MRKLRVTICLVALLAIAASTHAEDFTLIDTQHLDITTSYINGYLWDFSTANVLTGGDISCAYVNDEAILDISGGYVDELAAYNNSTVNVFTGNVGDNGFSVHDSSTLNVFGGNFKENISARDSSMVNISGGSIEMLQVDDLWLNGPQRVNIDGGTIATLRPTVILQGNEHINHIANFSLSDLTPYGIQAAPGIVGVVKTSFTTRDTTSIDISDGSLYDLKAYHSSTMDISGGSVGSLQAYDTTTVGISGGDFSWVAAYDNSTANISGASIQNLHTFNSSTIDISGGSVIWLRAKDSSKVNISAVNISGYLTAEDDSTVIFDGYDFTLSQGLSWDIDSQTILGTGFLSGKWFGQTEAWTIQIDRNDPTATIMAIPEPATLVFLSLASFAIIKKRKA